MKTSRKLASLFSSLMVFSVLPRAHAAEVVAGDCESINQAIRALPAEGGSLTLGAGLFTCLKPVVIDRDNITITGQGRTKTFLKAADGKPMPVVIIGSAVNIMPDGASAPIPDHVTHNISFSGMSIDGNYKSHPHPGDVECYDPAKSGSLSCGADGGYLIRNNSLTIRRTEHARINDNETRGAFSGGIVLEKKNVDIRIDHFYSYDNYFDGFAGYETAKSLFTNFEVSKNQFSGISVDWGFEGNLFDTGLMADNGDNGVFSADVGHNTYQNLTLTNNRNLGIYIAGYFDQSQGGKPVPNTCDGNRMVGIKAVGPKAGIFINSPCKGTTVVKADVTQAEMKCKWNFPGAEVSYEGSTCSDGKKWLDLAL